MPGGEEAGALCCVCHGCCAVLMSSFPFFTTWIIHPPTSIQPTPPSGPGAGGGGQDLLGGVVRGQLHQVRDTAGVCDQPVRCDCRVVGWVGGWVGGWYVCFCLPVEPCASRETNPAPTCLHASTHPPIYLGRKKAINFARGLGGWVASCGGRWTLPSTPRSRTRGGWTRTVTGSPSMTPSTRTRSKAAGPWAPACMWTEWRSDFSRQ